MKQSPGDMLREFRENQGLSLRQFTALLNEQLPPGKGTYFMAVHNWETGQAEIPFYLWFYLAHTASGELRDFAVRLVEEMNP